MITVKSKKGKNFINTPLIMIIEARILRIICPAVMFAVRRTERDTGRAKNANSSIKTIRGAMKIGVPAGKNKRKKWLPWIIKPVIMTIRKIKAARVKVTAIWLVMVKAAGIMPSKLAVKMNKNKVRMKGINFSPLLPVVLATMS